MRVYVAGPYSGGDIVLNVRAAVEVAEELLEAGHAPYVPHLTHLWHLIAPRPIEDWYELDLKWLAACGAIVRIPGDSPGADAEVARARELGIPLYQLEDLL